MAYEGGALGRLASLASEYGATRVAQEARALTQRTAEGRFFVACVGQFKRGKSTLLNALVGESVLPVGVVPVTAAITVIRHGPEPRARVNMVDGRTVEIALNQVPEYVTEELNPGNEKRIGAVEVMLPSPILRGGLCLVDTPGIGSVFTSNTEATRAFVPHIDAALIVLGADPPISGDELALIEEVAKQVTHLICVLNKADRLTPDERRQASDFAQRVLAKRLSRPIGPLLEVSATQPSTRDWAQLERVLGDLAEKSGAHLVEVAQERGMQRLVAQLRHELREHRGALERPLEESERRLAALERTVAAAERSLKDLGVLLTAEQQRLAAVFEGRLNDFLKTVPALAYELLRDLSEDRKEALERSPAVARARVEAWHAEMRPVAEQLYSDAMDRFVGLANDFLAKSSGVAATALDGESGFRVPPRAFFTELLSFTGRSPIRWIADFVRGKRGMRSEVSRYFSWVLEVNAHRVASDLNDRVAQSRRLLEQEIRARLREVAAVSQRALEGARRSSAAGEPAVRAELARLDAALASLDSL
jgi:GTP-binding protein EngB required for normal cell division